MTDWKRWRGLSALVEAAVDQGASAVERVHLATANRPFVILEQIPAVKEPAQVVHEVHDTVVLGAYTSVRIVNHWVGKALNAALDVAESSHGVGTRMGTRVATAVAEPDGQADGHESEKLK